MIPRRRGAVRNELTHNTEWGLQPYIDRFEKTGDAVRFLSHHPLFALPKGCTATVAVSTWPGAFQFPETRGCTWRGVLWLLVDGSVTEARDASRHLRRAGLLVTWANTTRWPRHLRSDDPGVVTAAVEAQRRRFVSARPPGYPRAPDALLYQGMQQLRGCWCPKGPSARDCWLVMRPVPPHPHRRRPIHHRRPCSAASAQTPPHTRASSPKAAADGSLG